MLKFVKGDKQIFFARVKTIIAMKNGMVIYDQLNNKSPITDPTVIPYFLIYVETNSMVGRGFTIITDGDQYECFKTEDSRWNYLDIATLTVGDQDLIKEAISRYNETMEDWDGPLYTSHSSPVSSSSSTAGYSYAQYPSYANPAPQKSLVSPLTP